MKLPALHALLAAVEEGSLRAAARRLGVSQPALSKLVRELERELGAPVLQRSTGGVFATAQGQVLVEHARRALRELDDARTQIDQLGGQMVGELAVAAVPLAVLVLLPEAVRTYAQAYPEIRLRLREELYLGQLGPLRAGEADIVLSPLAPGLATGDFETEPLLDYEMAVVTGPHNPLPDGMPLAQLHGARWVYTSLIGQTGMARDLFERHGMAAPPAAAMVNSTLALLALLSQGNHLGMMPLAIARHPSAAPFLRVVAVAEGNLRLSLLSIVRRGAQLKPALRHFLVHLQRAAHQVRGGLRG